jgi:chlorobactene glucosyltransferase
MSSALRPDLSLYAALTLALAILATFALARIRYLQLPKLAPPPPGTTPPDCMVIIPARDEEFFIARAVSSLPQDTVIVVDDHSTDRTAEAARKAGAGVIPAPDPPRRAVGKANACLAGARVLTSKWILFADADTCFAPGFLESAVSAAESSGISLLSIHLPPEFATWPEKLFFPYARALFFTGVTPHGDPAAIFNGQCFLVRREAYEFLGGHAAVLNSLIDDVKIAALARRHRLNFATARAASPNRVRFREPVAFLHRAAYRFLLISFASGGAILFTAALAALWLPVLLWLILRHHPVAAAIFFFIPSLATLAWYENLADALLAPLALYALPPILYRTATRALLGRPVEWKGRTI